MKEACIIAYGKTWDWKGWDPVGTMQDVLSLLEHWADKYHCQHKAETSSATAAHFAYEDCKQNARVQHCRLANADHGWPAAIDGEAPSDLTWAFLSRHSLSARQ